MSKKMDDDLRSITRCPECGGSLSYNENEIVCENPHIFRWIEKLPCFLDESFLPNAVSKSGLNAFERSGKVHSWAMNHWHEFGLGDLIPAVGNTSARALCVGGGDVHEKKLLKEKGYITYSFDVDPIEGIDMLADAHQIPFVNESFDLLTSFEVLEHLQEPWKAASEISRLLKPGGLFVGSVAFLKPFHSSYFHMTHWGVASLLERAGMLPVKMYGVQNPITHITGKLAPLWPKNLSGRVYNAIFRSINFLRIQAWRISRGKNPHKKTDRYGGKIPLSFAEFDRLRFCSAVVFTAIKK